MPHNRDAEEGLLACCILDPDNIDKCLDRRIEPDSFYDPSHALVFGAATEVWKELHELDEITLAERLKSQGHLEEIGGLPFINRLTSRVDTTAHVRPFMTIVRQKHRLRILIREAVRTLENAYQPDADPEDVAGESQMFFIDFTADTTSSLQPASVVVQESYARMEGQRTGAIPRMGLSTGLVDLNGVTNGLHPGMIVLGARPSVGKSALAMSFAEAVALHPENPQGVVYFALEMSNRDMGVRFLCKRSRVGYFRYIDGIANAGELEKVQQARSELAHAPIWFEDRSTINAWDIRSTVRSLKSQHPIGLVIVDMIQLIDGSKSGKSDKSREQELTEISRNLKGLASELHLPVVVVSSMNRRSENENRKPRMADLRDCGSIESDADLILLLHRRPVETAQVGETIDCIVAKNRHGPTGEVPLTFLKHVTSFENYAH